MKSNSFVPLLVNVNGRETPSDFSVMFALKVIVIMELIIFIACINKPDVVIANHPGSSQLTSTLSVSDLEAVCFTRFGDAPYAIQATGDVVSVVTNTNDGWQAKPDERVYFHGWWDGVNNNWVPCEDLSESSQAKTVIYMHKYTGSQDNYDYVGWDANYFDGTSSNQVRLYRRADVYFSRVPDRFPISSFPGGPSFPTHIINHEFGHILGLGDPGSGNSCLRPDGRTWQSVMHNPGHTANCAMWVWPTVGDRRSVTWTVDSTFVPSADIGVDETLGSSPAPGPQNSGADLEVLYQLSPTPPVNAGRSIDITVIFRNKGPNTATNVTANIGSPEGAAVIAVSNNSAGCGSTPPVICNVGSVSRNQSKSVTIQALIDPGASSARIEARVRGSQTDPYPTNNTNDQDIKVTWASDLSLAVSPSTPSTSANSDVTYSLSTSNDGPVGVTGAAVSTVLPAGVIYRSSSGVPCSYDSSSRVVYCPIGVMNPGLGPPLSIVLQLTAPGTIVNRFSLTAAEPERDPASNSAQAIVAVSPQTDLSVLQSTSASSVLAGDSVSYTLTVNNAPQAGQATGVRLTDTLMRGGRFLSAQGANCSLNSSEAAVDCELGAIGPGGSSSVVITVAAGPIGLQSNRAEVVSNEGDATPANNASVVQTDVLARNCVPRPPITVVVSPAGQNTLRVDISPMPSGAAPANQVGILRFGPLPPPGNQTPMANATIDVAGETGKTGVFDVSPHRSLGPSGLSFLVKRPQSGHPSFVPFRVVDDCGEWSTFVGGGAAVWGNNLKPMPSQVTVSAVAGAPLTYGVTITNLGETDVDSASAISTIPSGTTLISATSSQGACDGSAPVICSLGHIAHGSSATISIVVGSMVPGEVYFSTYAVSDAYDRGDVESYLTVTTVVDPAAAGPPNALPSGRPLPGGSGTPVVLPETRSGQPNGGQPEPLPTGR